MEVPEMDMKFAPTGAPLAIESPEAAIARAQVLITEAIEILRPRLHPLPLKQRKQLPPVPHEFPGAAVPVLDAIANAPKLLALCEDLDPAAIGHQLALVNLLAPLANRLDLLADLVGGTQQTLLGQSYSATLPAYRIAKAAADSDPMLQLVVAPLQEMYANRKKAPRTEEAETQEPPPAGSKT